MSHLRIKICGITSTSDARAAVALGVDAIGLNFYPQSSRYLPPAEALRVLGAIPPLVSAVGVFVNKSAGEAATEGSSLPGLCTLQCHGDRPPEDDAGPYRLVVAFQIRDESGLEAVQAYLGRRRQQGKRLPDALLVDAFVPGQYGGTGQTAPWELLAGYQPGLPLILAGGLTPENVGRAVKTVRPYAVDVAGGVEVRPGQKDPEKMRRFIENAREAAAAYPPVALKENV